MDEDEKMEQEAQQEWVRRGLPASEFTLAKMLEVWEKEHQAAAEAAALQAATGAAFAQKREALEKRAGQAYTAARLKADARKAAKGARDEVLDLAYDLGGLVEPGWVKRAKRKRRNLRRIRKAEEAERDFAQEKKGRLHELLAKQAEIEKRRKERKRQIRKAKPTDDLKAAAVEEEKEDRRQAEIDAFVRRRKAAAAEKEAQYQAMIAAEREKHEDQLSKMREDNLQRWGRVAEEQQEAAARLKRELDEGREERRGRPQRELEAQRGALEGAWEHAQVAGPAVSEDREGLGVFGVPQLEGDFHAPRGGGHLPGADEFTVAPAFLENQHPDHELKRSRLMESEAEAGRREALYLSLTDELAELEEDADALTQLRDRVRADLAQVRGEHEAMVAAVRAPPLRDFTPDEVAANSFRLETMARMKKAIEDVDKKREILDQKMRPMRTQSLRVAQELATLRERNRALREEVEGHNHGLGELPMVVGKSIAKVEGVGLLQGKPAEAEKYLKLKSKAALLKEEAREALKLHREARKKDNLTWYNKQQKMYSEDALEGLLNRLAAATDRLKRAKAQDVQSSLVTALQLFFANKEKLRAVRDRFEGTVHWWSARDPARTFHVDPWGGIRETARGAPDPGSGSDEEEGEGEGEGEGEEEGGAPPLLGGGGGGGGDGGGGGGSGEGRGARGGLTEGAGPDAEAGGEGAAAAAAGEGPSPSPSPTPTPAGEAPGSGGGGSGGGPAPPPPGAVGGGFAALLAAEQEGAEQQAAGEASGGGGGGGGGGGSQTTGTTADDTALDKLLALEEGGEEEEEEDPGRQGVSLGAAQQGTVMGVFPFPKFGLWRVRFAVTRKDPFDLAAGDKTDWVSVKLGPGPGSLKPLGQFKNWVRRKGDQDVRHEVVYVVRAAQLAYRFDFQSSTAYPGIHMAVEAAHYETHRLEPLEEFEGGRVLSSYVKLLKVEEATGDVRHTRVLVDLIRAMDSDQPFWDSGVLTATPQRYERRAFLELARAALATMRRAKEAAAGGRLDKVRSRLGALRPGGGGAEDRRMIKVKDSMRRYVERKQAQYWPKVQEEQKKEGKVYAVFDEIAQQWRFKEVLRCEVRWVENGTVAVCRHTLQEIDRASLMPVADPEGGVDMSLLRCYESQAMTVDADARAAHAKFSEEFGDMLRARKRSTAAVDAAAENYEAALAKERRRYERARALALGRERSKKEREAALLVRTAAVRAELAPREAVLLHQLRAGIGVEQRRTATRKDARELARKRWQEQWVEEAVAEKAAVLEERFQEHAARLGAELAAVRRAAERRHARLGAELARRRAELTAQRRAEVNELIKGFKIPNFEKAVPQNDACYHPRTKHWGSLYGKGERCLDCGKELTLLHHEKTQQMGIGSGEDPKKMEAIARHAKNENSFRFESSEQLAWVEQERVRLEKERRQIKEKEVFFYDLEEAKFIYDFDRRHQVYFKEQGVFRQGVQWTPAELAAWRKEREAALGEMSPRSRLAASKKLNDYMELLDMPTYRQYDARRYAHFQDVMHLFSRVYNFRLRLRELKGFRVRLVLERGERAERLRHLHREAGRTEALHRLVAGDLARAARLLKARADTAARHAYAVRVLKAARRDKRAAEMERAGVEDTAFLAEERAAAVAKENRELLRHRIRAELLAAKAQKKAGTYRRREEKKRKELREAERRLETFLYKRKHAVVPTPYGVARVLAYRKQDDVVIAALRWGDPPARAYVRLADCVALDRAVAQATTTAMEEEEKLNRAFYKSEATARAREEVEMAREDHLMRALVVLERENKWEQDFMAASIKEGEYFAKKVVRGSLGRGLLRRRLEVRVRLAADARERAIDRWRGFGLRPKPLTVKEMKKVVKEARAEVREQFREEQVALSRWTAERLLTFRRTEKMQAVVCAEFIDEFLLEFMQVAAKGSLQNGLDTKDTSEKATGIVFADPRHMQYPIYYTLREWWIGRKLRLQDRLQLWGVQVAKETDRWEEERKKHDAMEAEVKRREAEAAERRRQDQLCRAMLAEEQACRAFYRWELRRMLAERRAMAAADREMREYVKQLEIMEAHRKQELFEEYGTTEVRTVVEGGSDLELRRLEIKHKKVEGRRIERELAQMRAEDELAFALRAAEKKAAALKKLKEEMALLGGDYADLDLASDPGTESEGEHYSSSESDLTHSETESEKAAEARRRARDPALAAAAAAAARRRRSSAVALSSSESGSSDDDGGGGGAMGRAGAAAAAAAGAGALRKQESDALTFSEGGTPRPPGAEAVAAGAAPPGLPSLAAGGGALPLAAAAGGRATTKKRKKKPKKSQKEIEAELRQERRHLRRRVRAIKALRWAKRRRAAAERVAAEEIEAMHLKTSIAKAQAELDWMEGEELAKQLEEEVRLNGAHTQRLRVHSDARGREELDARHQARKKRQVSDLLVGRDEDAARWLRACTADELRWRKTRERVEEDTKSMDTMALSGHYQRWETDILYPELYTHFFRTLTHILATRAETIGCERRAMKVQEMLGINKRLSEEKDRKMGQLWKKHQRSELMRLRRSELGRRLFGKSQLKALRLAFGGWVWFAGWVKGLKGAFELKFETVRHDLDVDAAFPAMARIMDRPRQEIRVAEPQDDGPGLPKTHLTQYKERPVQCAHCGRFYLEGQNTNVACAFHTGAYRKACPRDCTGLTDKCMAHRANRWTCCDNRDKGNAGCQVRFHTPPAADPGYAARVARIQGEDEDEEARLDQALAEVRREDWKARAFKAKTDQLAGLEARLRRDRAVVARYDEVMKIK